MADTKTDETKETSKVENTMISKSGKPLVECNIKRDDDGVKLYIKSHREFKALRTDGSDMTFGGIKCFRPKVEELYGIKGRFVVTNDSFQQFI